jgi:hypothetical protein
MPGACSERADFRRRTQNPPEPNSSQVLLGIKQSTRAAYAFVSLMNAEPCAGTACAVYPPVRRCHLIFSRLYTCMVVAKGVITFAVYLPVAEPAEACAQRSRTASLSVALQPTLGWSSHWS